jgi:hypothetical protein
MRHTFASWAIAAGPPTFEIAATMGTSLEQLSKTYAHLLPDSADRARVALDAYITKPPRRQKEHDPEARMLLRRSQMRRAESHMRLR